jgi:hypothetical protein
MDAIAKRPGRRKGSVNTPEHNAAISQARQKNRGFTDQEVVTYYREPHNIRECGKRFGLSFQSIGQILKKVDAARPRNRRLSSLRGKKIGKLADDVRTAARSVISGMHLTAGGDAYEYSGSTNAVEDLISALNALEDFQAGWV